MSLTKKVWEGMWTGTAASMIENVLRIPRMMIVARVLGPELYGILGIFGVFREFIGKFIQLGTGDAVIQFLAAARGRKDYTHIGATMRAAGLIRLVTISVCLSLVLVFEKELITWLSKYPAAENLSLPDIMWLVRLLLIGIVIQAMEGPLGNALQGFQAWRSLLVVRIVGAFASTGLPIIAALGGYHLLGIVVAQQVAFFIIAVTIAWYYFKKVSPILERPDFSETLHTVRPVLVFGLPLIFSQIFRLVYTYADQLMLASMGKGAEGIGYYEVARNVALMLAFVPTLLRSVMFPASAEFYADQNLKRLEALFTFMVKHLFWFLLPLGVWMSVLSPLIVEIVAGPQYIPAAPGLTWLAMLMVMRAFGVPFFTCLVGALGRTKEQFYISAAGGALNVLLNMYWIPMFGYMGAVYATATGHLLSFTMAVLFLMPHMKLNFPLRRMFICTVFAAATAILLNIGYSYHKIAPIVLLPLATIIYIWGIIRFGLFDWQDLEYVDRLVAPVTRRYRFLKHFLEKYATPTRPKDRLN